MRSELTEWNRSVFHLAIALCSSILANAQAAGEAPVAWRSSPGPTLRAAMSARLEAASGRVRFTDTLLGVPREASSTEPPPVWRELHWSGPDWIEVELGDEHGVRHRGKDGRRSRSVRSLARRVLHKDGKSWVAYDDDTSIRFQSEAPQSPPPWLLGVTPIYGGRFPEHALFAERAESDRVIAVVRIDSTEYRYRIDPRRGWSVDRVEEFHDGRSAAEAHLEPCRFGLVWFPSFVELRRAVPGTESATMRAERRFQVVWASLDPVGAAPGFTLADIGADVGYTIDENKLGPIPPRNWAGPSLGVIPFEEYSVRQLKGLLSDGPKKLAHDRMWTLLAGTWTLDQADPLRRYPWAAELKKVHDYFVARYQFNADQRRQAGSILSDCIQRGVQRCEKHAAELQSLADRIWAAYDPEAGDSAARTASAADLQAIERRRNELIGPVLAMGEKELIPRIHALLTDAQRERAARLDQKDDEFVRDRNRRLSKWAMQLPAASMPAVRAP